MWDRWIDRWRDGEGWRRDGIERDGMDRMEEGMERDGMEKEGIG